MRCLLDTCVLFGSRVLPLDAEIADKWGNLRACHQTLPAIDSLLAATALTRDLIFVTCNTKYVISIAGLKILNPWQ